LIEELSDVLEERVIIKENGGKRTITVREAVFKQFAKQGAMGNLKAVKMLFELLTQIDLHNKYHGQGDANAGTTARERVTAKLERLRERMIASGRIVEHDT
jgi:hypothetical protein